MKKWLKIIGYSILIISCILWGLILIIPWMHFSRRELVGMTTVLIISGEITFYLGLLLAGRSILETIKSKLFFWRKKDEIKNRKSN